MLWGLTIVGVLKNSCNGNYQNHLITVHRNQFRSFISNPINLGVCFTTALPALQWVPIKYQPIYTLPYIKYIKPVRNNWSQWQSANKKTNLKVAKHTDWNRNQHGRVIGNILIFNTLWLAQNIRHYKENISNAFPWMKSVVYSNWQEVHCFF